MSFGVVESLTEEEEVDVARGAASEATKEQADGHSEYILVQHNQKGAKYTNPPGNPQ